jgi:(p)ppGpp synthase/HD superfamily hydrolase
VAAAGERVSDNDRTREMARRVADTATQRGFSSADRDVIARAFSMAMEVRAEKLGDDHHPGFLHPGRTALILFDDADARTVSIVAAGCVLDSVHAELRVRPELLPDDVRELVEEIPVPDESGEQLLEMLLAAGQSAQVIALAERLDYARHLHLTPASEWRGFHGTAKEIYLPVAARAHPVLERRLRWWCDMFERRFLAAGVAGQSGPA